MLVNDFIHNLSRKGKHFFTLDEVICVTEKSKSAVLAALERVQKKGNIVSPYRGFYIIVPPHYHAYGCLPAEQFIPDLMAYLGLPYYVGLLSAGQYYGAAHQKPQQFQVMTSDYLRSIECGKIISVFIKQQKILQVPTRQFNTPTGYIKVSTPEATALDLIQYPYRSGGINNILTVLQELAESITPSDLILCIKKIEPEIVVLQRLGFYLDVLQEKILADSVEIELKNYKLRARPLVAGISTKNSQRNTKWSLYINFNVESDL